MALCRKAPGPCLPEGHCADDIKYQLVINRSSVVSVRNPQLPTTTVVNGDLLCRAALFHPAAPHRLVLRVGKASAG